MDALALVLIDFARHPRKRLRSLEMVQNVVAVRTKNLRQQACGRRLVGNFTGHRENRIDAHRHRQLVPAAVVNHPPWWIDGDGSLLLPCRLLHVLAVLEHLQLYQSQADQQSPEKKESPKDVEPLLSPRGRRKFRQNPPPLGPPPLSRSGRGGS